MATKKKLLQAASGQAGGAGLDVEDVFSTYLYDGTSAEHTITNGIDLAGEGGMVWGKIRSSADQHWLVDSERGTGSNSNYKYLMSNLTNLESDFASRSVSSFNSNGFTLQNGTDKQFNESGYNYASWTFRKAPKFFDVVEWDGDSVAGRQIPHNLGSVPGAIFVKLSYMSGGFGRDWMVYHRGSHPTSPEDYRLHLNLTNSAYDESGNAEKAWNGTAPTDTHFTVGNDDRVNSNYNNFGWKYVAYVFAHNDGDGEFGPDGDQDIIKCGSFSVNGSYEADVDIGFEPQWVLIKPAQDSGSWLLFDTMRGAAVNGDAAWLAPDLSQQEVNTANRFWPTATGFHIGNYGIPAGNDIIYMAIRRGPLAQPESGTEVYQGDYRTGGFTSGFPVDFALIKNLYTPDSGDWKAGSRLTGQRRLATTSTAAEVADTNYTFDSMTGFYTSPPADLQSWMWKRAPGFFDAVAYVGNRTGGASQTISHNLTVTPEMIWVKNRTEAQPWQVYTAATGNTKAMYLDTTNGATTDNSWGNTSPTETNFTVGDDSGTNNTGNNHIAYLFASLPGISKVGSYTGNGSTQNIDCGFSSGARFVLIKRSSHAQDWYLFDSTRGIVAGSDPYLKLNSTDSEATSADEIDPLSSGFTIHQTGSAGINFSGHTYIFYAIA